MTTTPTDGLEALRERVLLEVAMATGGVDAEVETRVSTNHIMEAIAEHYQPIIEWKELQIAGLEGTIAQLVEETRELREVPPPDPSGKIA